jgi:hypothetical protein
MLPTQISTEPEMILTTQTTIQKIWLPEGEYPKIECATSGNKVITHGGKGARK